jgi:hypothetical protein
MGFTVKSSRVVMGCAVVAALAVSTFGVRVS